MRRSSPSRTLVRRSLPGTAVLTGVLVMVLAAPGASTAASTTGPTAPAGSHRAATKVVASLQTFERGTVTKIVDGDTIEVDLDRNFKPLDGCGKYDLDSCRVRFIGVQAPEIAHPGTIHKQDQCGARRAEALVASLLHVGDRVELRAQDPASRSQGRLLRAVFAQDANGDYTIDVQQRVLQAGLGLWWADERETANRLDNRLAMEGARAAGKGLWNPDLCQPDPEPDAQLSLMVIWDSLGVDGRNLNGERVIVYNHGSKPVSVGNWWLRDSGPHNYRFPSSASVPAGGRLVVAVGKGRDTARVLHMGWSHPRFPNPTGGDMLGDGAYLLDTRTNIRAEFIYPCPWSSCSDPARGALSIRRVSYSPKGKDTARREFLVMRNSSDRTIPLAGYYVRKNGIQLPFATSAKIAARTTVKVTLAKGKDTRTVKYLQRGRTMFGPSGSVQIATPVGDIIACKAWGGDSC